MYRQAGSSRLPAPTVTTEFDVLKASHKFLRDDADADGAGSRDASWEDRLAQKYYASLYREFAVCDLKHYKSGNFALRWRTEAEVLSGAGEETCGNTRCAQHVPPPSSASASSRRGGLKTVELPFAYEEHGARKSALVKVVLCAACLKKLMWKHEREKEERMRAMQAGAGVEVEKGGEGDGDAMEVKVEDEEGQEAHMHDGLKEHREQKSSKAEDHGYERRKDGRRRERIEEGNRRRRSSRSLSPSSHRRREQKDKLRRHEHTPPK